MKWISTASLVLCLGFGWMASQAMAQPGATGQSFDELNARLQQQDQQIQQLQAQMAAMQQQGVIATPTALAVPGSPAVPPAAVAATPPCAEVGSDMSAKVRFYNGEGLMFETPNKDFTFHLGGWVQLDNWGFNVPPPGKGIMAAPGTATVQGVAPGGIGDLQDGIFWRRIRLVMEGNFWETFEYRWNFAFENNQYSTVGLDEFWIGDSKLPIVGNLRVGHVKNCEGLEADMASSSRCFTFMERSSYSQAIEQDQNFVNGIWFGQSILDDRLFYSGVIFRPDNGSSGDFFGTGQWGWQTRITGLPIYEDEGRHLLHLGISGGWRDGANSSAGGADAVRLRSRPEMRDDDPAASPGTTTNQNGAGGAGQFLPDANANRMIDTGSITCNQEWLLGLEELYIRGPFSLQAEYGWNFLNNAQVTIPAAKPVEDYVFNGGYIQAAYTLTGENRAYDKKNGTLSRYYFGSQGPYENAFLVRDQDGGICAGHGAWEVAYRFSYTDLNSGPMSSGYVHGGIMQGHSFALNWYLNTNLTILNDITTDTRYDLPAGSVTGTVIGLGTRVQLSF